jgi:peptide chain release factor 3
MELNVRTRISLYIKHVVKPDDAKNNEFKEFKRIKQKFLAKDKYGQLVFLVDSDFTIQMTKK